MEVVDSAVPGGAGLQKKKRGRKKKGEESATKQQAEGVLTEAARATIPMFEARERDDPRVEVSMFDHSVENHLSSIDAIAKLCGEPESHAFRKADIDRFAPKITFLREWKHFNYKPRAVKFASETPNPEGRHFIGEIDLQQFSAATVPKEVPSGGRPPGFSNDFVLYVGGPIWALDWCPRASHSSDHHINCEFIAVAVHPPESSYHKIGASLTGRGMVQIWCLLTVAAKEEEVPPPAKRKGRPKSISNTTDKADNPKRPKGRPKGTSKKIDIPSQPKRPRGRPRKMPLNESAMDSEHETTPALAAGCPKDPSEPHARSVSLKIVKHSAHKDASKELKKPRGRPKRRPSSENFIVSEHQTVQALAVGCPENSSELHDRRVPLDVVEHTVHNDSFNGPNGSSQVVLVGHSLQATSKKSRRLESVTDVEIDGNGVCRPLAVGMVREASISSGDLDNSCRQNFMESNDKVEDSLSSELSPCGISIPQYLVLPRVVLCLAHNGKVAWDVKWRPRNAHNSECNSQMGYLAVLLGSGSLEVWDVPSPQIMKLLYSPHAEGTDPRFVKLEPVFRCSKLKCGNRQSIPLTLEWSHSFPYDLILAGCHDGTVALWKFSANDSSEDTRPLLCFRADTAPIRALAWAPVENDLEGENVIVTGGHEGLKFWDIRDPFRPLWDLNPVRRTIYSLDWLPDPRCLIISFDDGTLRVLSLLKAALDVPVTGKPFVGTQQQGFYSYYCSSFSIWSVHTSRHTGMVAYCSADGAALNFQLTTKAVEKEPRRNRAPHFLCGSLSEEESALTVNTPLPDTPFRMKKSLNEWANAPRTIRGFTYQSNQAKRATKHKAKGQNPDDNVLALCYGDDAQMEFDPDDTLASSSCRQTLKSKTSSTENTKSHQALVCRDEWPEEEVEAKGIKQEGNEIEVLPPKIVAMHRVRWNMNKGSERWLCFGGAAGILRCKEIVASNVNVKN